MRIGATYWQVGDLSGWIQNYVFLYFLKTIDKRYKQRWKQSLFQSVSVFKEWDWTGHCYDYKSTCDANQMKSTGTKFRSIKLTRLSRDKSKFGRNERKSDRTRAGEPVLQGQDQVCHCFGIFLSFLDLDFLDLGWFSIDTWAIRADWEEIQSRAALNWVLHFPARLHTSIYRKREKKVVYRQLFSPFHFYHLDFDSISFAANNSSLHTNSFKPWLRPCTVPADNGLLVPVSTALCTIFMV